MILRVNIIGGKVSVASFNGAGGFGGKFLGSKEHLDWLKIYFNAAEIITVQDYNKKNVNGSTHIQCKNI